MVFFSKCGCGLTIFLNLLGEAASHGGEQQRLWRQTPQVWIPALPLISNALITSCVNGDSVTTTYFIELLWELRLTFYSAYNSTWLFECLLNSNKTTTHQSMPSMSINQSWCPNWNPFVISVLVGTLYTLWHLHTLKQKCSETSGFVCLVHCCVPNVFYIEDAPSVFADWRHSPYTYSK